MARSNALILTRWLKWRNIKFAFYPLFVINMFAYKQTILNNCNTLLYLYKFYCIQRNMKKIAGIFKFAYYYASCFPRRIYQLHVGTTNMIIMPIPYTYGYIPHFISLFCVSACNNFKQFVNSHKLSKEKLTKIITNWFKWVNCSNQINSN